MKFTPQQIVEIIKSTSDADAVEFLELYAESCRQEGEKQGLEYAAKVIEGAN